MSRVFRTKIAGSAILMKLKHNDDTWKNCNLYLSRNLNDEELNIPKKLQFNIIHDAANCVKSFLCQKLDIIKTEDMTRAKNIPFNFGLLSVLFANKENSKSLSSVSRVKAIMNINELKSLINEYNNAEYNSVNRADLQSAINKLVDLAIAQLVKKIVEQNQGKIKIPNLSQSFSTGSSWWEPTGEFNAYDGSFEDLATLKRTEDASLSYKGLKFVAGCGFGLSVANLDYEIYELRYGIIRYVSGKLSASVDGVAMAASIMVDYNQKPCRAELQEVRVSELGKMKIKITGLGPLNSLLSKLVTWITKKWQVEIVENVEEKLRVLIVDNLQKFNCEKFRP